MAPSVHSRARASVVDAAKSLAPQILACREELESGRQLPPQLVQGMAASGLLQLFLPRSMGGPELDLTTAFHAVEAVSKVDGSVGWCSVISGGGSVLLGWAEPGVAMSFFGRPPDFRLAGSMRPEGRAKPVPGGYRVTGHWGFGSGITHANVVVCACKVEPDEAAQASPDVPQIRLLLLPPEAVTIHDTWSVVGMSGTGSHDYSVEDWFVPEEHTFSLTDPPVEKGPLYHPRLMMVAVWTPYVANLLGMARGAMDAFIELATEAGSTHSTATLRERAAVQAVVGEVEGIISSARAYALDALDGAWQAASRGGPDPTQEIAQARLAITHSSRQAVKAVDMLFHAGGTNAIFRKHSLERSFRDVHVAIQHLAGHPSHFEAGGRVMMGLPAGDIGW